MSYSTPTGTRLALSRSVLLFLTRVAVFVCVYICLCVVVSLCREPQFLVALQFLFLAASMGTCNIDRPKRRFFSVLYHPVHAICSPLYQLHSLRLFCTRILYCRLVGPRRYTFFWHTVSTLLASFRLLICFAQAIIAQTCTRVAKMYKHMFTGGV